MTGIPSGPQNLLNLFCKMTLFLGMRPLYIETPKKRIIFQVILHPVSPVSPKNGRHPP
jgi:hypothetical protein